MVCTLAPPHVRHAYGRLLCGLGHPNPLYDEAKARGPPAGTYAAQDRQTIDHWVGVHWQSFCLTNSLLQTGAGIGRVRLEDRPTATLPEALSVCLDAEGTSARALDCLSKVLTIPGHRRVDEVLDRVRADLPEETTHVRAYNIDNYAHCYYRGTLTMHAGRGHERTEGMYTGYGYTPTSVPLGLAARHAGAPALWPVGELTGPTLYDAVRHDLEHLLDAHDFGVDEDLRSPPTVQNAFQAPLGPAGTNPALTMKFVPVEMLDANISSTDGLIACLQYAQGDFDDSTCYHFCRADENIHRRITKLLSCPGGIQLAQRWDNTLWILSMWHGFKQLCNVMWSSLYTPFYSHLYAAVWPTGTMLRTPRLVLLQQWNNAIAHAMTDPTLRNHLLTCRLQHPNNDSLAALAEFLTVAIPRVPAQTSFHTHELN